MATDSSTQRSNAVPDSPGTFRSLALLSTLAIAACADQGERRARVTEASIVGGDAAPALELTQELRFSRSMRDALDAGVPLRLNYRVDGCGWQAHAAFELRYSPLNRHFELQRDGEPHARRYARRAALFAALDRIQLPLRSVPQPDCRGSVTMALDLTRLPTPLRIPAFFLPQEWRMVAAPAPWPTSRV